ncbi:DUF1259 domain-containing protein, partial [Streptomyces sp. NPDC005989]|uniref:DUF1259 domain-containing protein n=1 Tax=Streptomyces sp. NPDC005989 TaxID=3156727 RepID=UPI0033E7569B
MYKFSLARKNTVTDGRHILPPGLGITTAINFQPLGKNKAAINGDFVMTQAETQKVIQALRKGGIDIVELPTRCTPRPCPPHRRIPPGLRPQPNAVPSSLNAGLPYARSYSATHHGLGSADFHTDHGRGQASAGPSAASDQAHNLHPPLPAHHDPRCGGHPADRRPGGHRNARVHR